MVKSDSSWMYEAEPVGAGSWLTEKVYKTNNCLFKKITIEKVCNKTSCYIVTPFGHVNSSDNVYYHNHVTIEWDHTSEKVKKSRLLSLESGYGRLHETMRSDVFRLVDESKQVSFHLNMSSQRANFSAFSYQVIDMVDTYAVIGNKSSSLLEKKDPHSTQEWKVNEAAHYQFNSDSVFD